MECLLNNFCVVLCSYVGVWNGLRLTSCKSAKDRSSMSVTLEEVRTLEREHCMKEEVFSRVLNSVRRYV